MFLISFPVFEYVDAPNPIPRFLRVSVISSKEITLVFLTERSIRVLVANFVEIKSAFSIIVSLKQIGRVQ